jgi:hypothetical protein
MYATKKAVDEAFAAISEKLENIGDIAELKEGFNALSNKLRKSQQAAIMQGEQQTRNSFWRDEEMAKGFGEYIMAAIGRKALG